MENLKLRPVSEFNSDLKLKGFNVFQIEQDGAATRVYSRKDFYKICLTTGKSKIHYSDRSFETDGTVLFFGNPHIPYSWETLSTSYVGYTCLFSEAFLNAAERTESLQQSPLFKIGGTPILHISEQQREFLNTLFQRMIEEQRAEFTTGRECEPSRWNAVVGRVTGAKEAVKSINAYLGDLEQQLLDAHAALVRDDALITAETIKNKFLGIGPKQPFLMTVIADHNERMKALIGQEYAIGTFNRYKVLERHTVAFLKSNYSKTDFDISRTDFVFFEKIWHGRMALHLLSQDPTYL